MMAWISPRNRRSICPIHSICGCGRRFWCAAASIRATVVHSVKQQIVAVNPDQQATLWDDGVLESWIKNQPVFARGRFVSILFAAFSSWRCPGGHRSLQRRFLLCRPAHQRIRHPHGARGAKAACAQDSLRISGNQRRPGYRRGLGLSFALNRLIAQWVEKSSVSPLILLAASLLLLAVAALACLLPARRASAVDPMTALRRE